MPGWHYNGMAQLLSGSPQQAVFSWEKIKEKDPAYFAQNNLAQRVEVAKRMPLFVQWTHGQPDCEAG
jgi:hypothetical protein